MCKNIAFCEECREDVCYHIVESEQTATLKGEEYVYLGKTAYCDNCNSEVYVSEILDSNLQKLYDKYREKNNIISLKKILEIPKKYAIGKRPLSLLVGWGEQTFTRYCDGDMPTKQYSDILKQIYDDPQYYAKILETNKNNLKSLSTYEKSKKMVDGLVLRNETSKVKIDFIIEYLLYQCEDITPLALQKALYYIQGFYYAFFDTFIFTDDCEAWVHGPVYREVYYRYRDYQFEPIDKIEGDFNEFIFTNEEKLVLDSVIKHICCYSGKLLERFTHREQPWLLTRGNLPSRVPSIKNINKEEIGKYFVFIKDKYNMITPNDIYLYTEQMFSRYNC